MQFRGKFFCTALIFAAGALAQDQQATPPLPPSGEPTIRTETKLVLVDVVVTDKKGNYLSDLALKDFKVWEDNKEQGLKTFQFGADPSAPQKDRQRYMVLFFDNSTMDAADQTRARQEAGKFIDKNAGPDRLMAIVNYGGGLQISQNFTDDVERLKKVVSGIKFSATSPNAPATRGVRLGGAEAEFGTRSVLLGLRNLAKRLGDIPGRKSLVMFTSGFQLTPEFQPEVTAAIDACNRANVAIYPIDVRGLFAPQTFPFGNPNPRDRVMNVPPRDVHPGMLPAALRDAGLALASDPLLHMASLQTFPFGNPNPRDRVMNVPPRDVHPGMLPAALRDAGLALASDPLLHMASLRTFPFGNPNPRDRVMNVSPRDVHPGMLPTALRDAGLALASDPLLHMASLQTFPFGNPNPRDRVMNVPPQDVHPGMLPAALRDAGLALASDPLLHMASLLMAYLPDPEQGRGGGGAGAGGGTSAPSGGGGGAAPAGGGGGGSVGGGGGGGRGGAVGGGASPGGDSSGGFGSAGGRGGAGIGSAGIGGNSGNAGGRGGANPGGGGNFGGNNPGGLNNGRNLPVNRERVIVPTFPDSATTNQQVLYQLASGTGGFVIVNTNDLLGGLEKIGKEQNEYYIVGYTPPESKEGDCHVLRVKVNRGGTNWRARTGYCNSRSVDVLAGKPIEKQLETQAAGAGPGTITATMTVPYFYTAPDTARVNVAIELPGKDIKFDKVKGKMHAEFNVLGIVYRQNANVAARFSDTVKLDFEDKKEVEKFAEKQYHYENQFDVASGQYNLKVAFSSGGESFGKLESPLNIDAYDGEMFMISALALSKSFHKVADIEASMDAALLEGRAPLVAQAYQFDPAGANRFKASENVAVYFEVYDPKMTDEKPPTLAVQLKVIDRKAAGGAPKLDSGGVDVSNFVRKGNPLVPIGLKVPVKDLPAGSYRLELTAQDGLLRTMVRSADFDVN